MGSALCLRFFIILNFFVGVFFGIAVPVVFKVIRYIVFDIMDGISFVDIFQIVGFFNNIFRIVVKA